MRLMCRGGFSGECGIISVMERLLQIGFLVGLEAVGHIIQGTATGQAVPLTLITGAALQSPDAGATPTKMSDLSVSGSGLQWNSSLLMDTDLNCERSEEKKNRNILMDIDFNCVYCMPVPIFGGSTCV